MDETPQNETLQTHEDPIPEAPNGMFGALDELLRKPGWLIVRAQRRELRSLPWLVVGALFCFLIYGLASGFFQGGSQVFVTGLKVPLIIFGSLALCLPSLYVLTALAGVDVSLRWFLAVAVGLVGMLGLLLIALMPITWLFSVSSSSLGFIVVLHCFIWFVAVVFAYRFLSAATHEQGGAALVAWLFLFIFVSLQVTSQMRPVLWRADGMALFEPEKMFFLQHLGRVLESEEGPNNVSSGS